MQNFVGIHPDLDDDPKKGTLRISKIHIRRPEKLKRFLIIDHKDLMLHEFAHFHPNVRRVIQYVLPTDVNFDTLTLDPGRLQT